MKRRMMLISALIVSMLSSAAWAQRRQPTRVPMGSEPEHRVEIIPYGGYVWTVSRDFDFIDTNNVRRRGNLDIKSGGMYGVEIDFNLPFKPGSQLQLLYNRQDSELEFKSSGFTTQTVDFAVEYWQIGGVYGIRRDQVLPFSSLSIGGTRYSGDVGDEWKFSMILGLGAKIYINERVGIRLAGRMPFTFFSSGFGLGVGTGGAYVSLGGTGIAQFDVSGGLVITL